MTLEVTCIKAYQPSQLDKNKWVANKNNKMPVDVFYGNVLGQDKILAVS